MFLFISATVQDNNPFPEIERYKLKNGLEVIFADYGELPVTTFTFFVNVGKKSDTPGQQGLASLTATSLLLGNANYTRIEQDRILHRTGGSISASSNKNFTQLTAQFLNKDIEKGMELASCVLLKPAFPQQEIDEVKGFTLSQNKPSKMDIGDLANVYGDYFVYGTAHPLGRHYYETQYKKLTSAQINEFYSFNYTPGNTKLVVTGKPDREKVKQLIEKYFGGWTAAYGEMNSASYDVPPIKGKTYAFIGKAGAAQACLEWMKKAPGAGDKDVVAFTIANAIFSDRLMNEIREERGYTYGIYSMYSEAQNDGIFRAKTQVRAEVMYSTITAFDEVLDNFYKNGATEAELRKLKTMLKADILSLEEPAAFCSLINPWVHRDYEKRRKYLADIEAVDLETLNKTIKKYFTSYSYKLIIAGDATALNEQLGKLNGLQKLELNVIEKDE